MGLYIVRRDAWYTERAVWGIAGVVIATGTVLGAFVQPWLVGIVTVTGLFALVTAFTGFCPVSTVLTGLGVPTFLGTRRGGIYRMRTDRWYLERTIYLVVGTTQTVGSILAVVHHPGWLFFTGFVGAMSVGFALSGFCPVANALWFLGLEPRLSPIAEEARSELRRVA